MEMHGGQLLSGRFEVVGCIGRGGCGVVYEVLDHESESHLALKTVQVPDPELLVALKREFRAVQDVSHPNLVRLDELFEDRGTWFFTMELVDGSDWLTYVRRTDGGVALGRIRATLPQIIEALTALHAHGLVHRDVKPPNVLVSTDGTVKLLDFGITSRGHASSASDVVVGTIAYMSPEQLAGAEPIPATDFYALGVMVFEAISGAPPFASGNINVDIRRKIQEEPPSLGERARGTPKDLVRLCDALLRRAHEERPDAPAILRMLGAPAGPSVEASDAPAEVFVGRSAELDALARALADASAGAVSLVLEGPSGVGKSALVRRFARDVEERALVLQGRCHEREYVPYKGLDAIVDELSAHLARESDAELRALDGEEVELLLRLFPVLERVPYVFERVPAEQTTRPAQTSELRTRTFAAFRAVLAFVARKRPVVLAIDDIQWADSDTFALLADVLAPPAPRGLLLVCARRTDGDESELAAPPWLPRAGRRLTLGRLSAPEVTELAAQLARARNTPLADEALAAIIEESGGHPLFLQELVRRYARGEAGATTLRLEDAVWTRTEQLADVERRLVEAVAVAAAPTPLDVVAAAALLPRGELPQSLAALRTANLVKVSTTGDGRWIEPYHDRVREAVVQHLNEPARRVWHERLARALEARPDPDPQRLAVHWEGAGDGTRAAPLYRDAAERASAALAFDRAAELYGRALDLGGEHAPWRRELLLARAEALFDAGRGAEAGDAFRALAGCGTDRAAIELRGQAARAYLTSGYLHQGIAMLRAATDAVGIPFPQRRLAALTWVRWERYRLRRRGLALAVRDSAPDDRDALRVDVCWFAAHGIAMADALTGHGFHALSARLALELGDPFRAARALAGNAVALSTGGRQTRRATEDVIGAARALNGARPDPYVDAYCDAADGFVAYMAEELVVARERFLSATARFREACVGICYEVSSLGLMLGRTRMQLGLLKELNGEARTLLRDAVRRNDRYSIANMRSILALPALAADDVVEAQSQIDEAEAALIGPSFQIQHVLWLVAACTVDLYRGAPDAALARLERHGGQVRRSRLEKVASIRIALGSLRARIHLALAARSCAGSAADTTSTDERIRLALAAAKGLAREQLPGAMAHAALARAGAAAVCRDDATAVRELRDASARYAANQMRLHAASADFMLARCVGGDEARVLESTAIARCAEQGAAQPARFFALYAPGFSRYT
jgi:hypothetical protein